MEIIAALPGIAETHIYGYTTLLEEIGGEGIFKLATELNVSHTGAIRQLASSKRDLGKWLDGVEQQKGLDICFTQRAEDWEPFRNYITRGLSLPAGKTSLNFASSDSSIPTDTEAWEKVFQIFFGSESHEQ